MSNTAVRGGLLALALLLAGCGSAQNQMANPSAVRPSLAASVQASAAPSAAQSPQPSAEPSAGETPEASADESVAASASGSAQPGASTATFDPARVQIGLEEVASGFAQPLRVTGAGDGSGRVFVVEKGGTIRTLDGQPFLDISDRVRASGSEQGLLGLAFHPRFKDNGFLFVNYIDADGNTVIARFTAQGDQADPASEKIILQIDQPAANHNGGNLLFGPDGFLYIGMGDGGGANDTYQNGQNRQALLGKLLRLDVDSGDPYAIPADNPFVNESGTRPEIFALGLRNPWRFSFDRQTGDLYIGDVGQNRYEWLHVRPAGQQGGENFGWPILEGTHCLDGSENCDRTGFTVAVADYPHSQGCTVVGGYVYRGQEYPALQGGYVFGDYCSGTMWTLTPAADGAWQLNDAFQASAGLSSFGEDDAGELYATNLGTGQIFRVTGTQR